MLSINVQNIVKVLCFLLLTLHLRYACHVEASEIACFLPASKAISCYTSLFHLILRQLDHDREPDHFDPEGAPIGRKLFRFLKPA